MKKYIFLLTLLSLSAMEKKPLSAQESSAMLKYKNYLLHQTPEYQYYERTKQDYEKNKTDLTYKIMHNAAKQVYETKEFKDFSTTLEIEEKKQQMSCTPSFSTDVLSLHARLEETPAYKQYQAAKRECERFGDSSSIQVVEFCKKELANSPEYQNWIKAVEKEKHVVVQMQQKHNERYNMIQTSNQSETRKSERWCWFIDENIKKPESKVAVIYLGK